MFWDILKSKFVWSTYANQIKLNLQLLSYPEQYFIESIKQIKIFFTDLIIFHILNAPPFDVGSRAVSSIIMYQFLLPILKELSCLSNCLLSSQ